MSDAAPQPSERPRFGSIGCAIVFGAAVLAGACGTFVGVLVALVRAGWRAGASL